MTMGQGVNLSRLPDTARLLTMAPAGPVSAAFEASNAPVEFIVGPVGAGKTTTCVRKLIRRAAAQPVSPVDGQRRYKALVLAATHAQIKANWLSTWNRYFPQDLGSFTGEPLFRHTLEIAEARGPIEFELIMRSIGEHRIEEVLRGFEGTDAYLYEADLTPLEAMNLLPGRLRQWYGVEHGRPRHCIFGDLNAPDEDSAWYDRLYINRPAGWTVRVMPGGRSPHAENMEALGPDYYARQIDGMDDWAVRRLIDNIPGMSRAGMPVYPEYVDARHFSPQPLPVLDRPLIIGADQGLHPAVVILQRAADGQMRCMDEVVGTGEGEDALEFGQRVAWLLADRYRGLPVAKATADPAGWKRSEVDRTQSWSRAFAKVAGLRLTPANTNQPELRQSALRNLLKDTLDGDRPCFLLNSTCPVLRRALTSGYRRKKASNTGSYWGQVDKNEYSHPAEALEYAVLGGGGLHEAMQRRAGMANASRPVVAPHEFGVV